MCIDWGVWLFYPWGSSDSILIQSWLSLALCIVSGLWMSGSSTGVLSVNKATHWITPVIWMLCPMCPSYHHSIIYFVCNLMIILLLAIVPLLPPGVQNHAICAIQAHGQSWFSRTICPRKRRGNVTFIRDSHRQIQTATNRHRCHSSLLLPVSLMAVPNKCHIFVPFPGTNCTWESGLSVSLDCTDCMIVDPWLAGSIPWWPDQSDNMTELIYWI